jgi:hypothetical protein
MVGSPQVSEDEVLLTDVTHRGEPGPEHLTREALRA